MEKLRHLGPSKAEALAREKDFDQGWYNGILLAEPPMVMAPSMKELIIKYTKK